MKRGRVINLPLQILPILTNEGQPRASHPNAHESVAQEDPYLHTPVKTHYAITLILSANLVTAMADSAPGRQQLVGISEYRVEGAKTLPPIEIERTLTPFLGPSRTADDVEKARSALEKAYHDKGYQTVAVSIPPQRVDNGVVTLLVEEVRVGRLRIRGSKYHDLDEIRTGATSLREGTLPDFNAVRGDILALNDSSDMQVSPAFKPGVEPGTVDVDLMVKDELPLHGSLELNNRNSPDTKPLRLNGALHYDNLWQMGHGIGCSFQVAPERVDDARIFSAYYSLKPAELGWLTLMIQGTKQNSDVNTLGAFNVAGRGEVIGLRAIANLPTKESYFHSLNFGVDYKHFDTDLTGGGANAKTPITYYPFSAGYTGTKLWSDGSSSQGNLGATWHFDGMGGDSGEFTNKRSGAYGDFFFVRWDFSHTQKLPEDIELFGQVQTQASRNALVSNEQFGIGGLTSVRGYYESEAVGDSAVVLSSELRSPSFTCGGRLNEWRVYLFGEWAGVSTNKPLPGQQARFELASAGVGTRLKFADHFKASADVGIPLLDGPRTDKGDVHVVFTVSAEF